MIHHVRTWLIIGEFESQFAIAGLVSKPQFLEVNRLFTNPLPTIRNSLNKQKSLYKVLTSNIKTAI